MDLTAKEAEDAFQFLAGALQDLGLDWVLHQVRDKIALGKVHTKRLKATEYLVDSEDMPFLPGGPRTAKRTALFTVSGEFPPAERLGILLESIVLPVIREIAQQTFASLVELEESETLSFAPEVEGREPFTITRSDLIARSTAAAALERLIAELRGDSTDAVTSSPSR